MEDQDNNSDYNNVVDKLLETFGEILSRDIMFAIVESYKGDLDGSANAIINITTDDDDCASPTSTENELSSPNTIENMDENCVMPNNTGNDGKTNILPVSTNNQHANRPDVIQQQRGQFYPSNAFCPSTQNSPSVKQPAMSYAGVSNVPSQLKNQGVRPILKTDLVKTKAITKTKRNIEHLSSATNHKIKNIYKYHESGWSTLIILRGAPGSGKSFIAHKIIDAMCNNKNDIDYKTHIFSTDQYFMRNGVYEFCKFQLSEAHQWNLRRAQSAIKQGISPVIIDNTNIEIWEMRPYVESGVNYGYIIEVLESDTPWAKKAQILYNKGSHNVPYINIRRMLDNYQTNVTGEYLLRHFGYSYKPDKTPPVLRKVPPFSVPLPKDTASPTNLKAKYAQNDGVKKDRTDKSNLKQHPHNYKKPLQNTNNTQTNLNTEVTQENKPETSSPKSSDLSEQIQEYQENNASSISLLRNDSEGKQKNVSAKPLARSDLKDEQTIELYIQNKTETNLPIPEADDLIQLNDVPNTLEILEKLEIEWESGEKWEDADKSKTDVIGPFCTLLINNAKPQRMNKLLKSESTDSVIHKIIKKHEDWSTLCMFLPSWADENKIDGSSGLKNSKPVVEKASSYTCIEIGDTNICSTKNPFKIISAVPRDINEFHLPITNNKIPDQWMLHKSTSTHDNLILAPTRRCKNEEQHFEVFATLFKNTDKSVLKDIFDKCCGDVNWAVDIVLDDMASKNLDITDNINTPTHDSDVPVFDCECLSAYNLIPDRLETVLPVKEISIQEETQSPIILKKNKKESATSEASMELKRKIEKNIVIPDNHYSEHCLKIRKYRRGEVDILESVDNERNSNLEPQSSDPPQTSKLEDLNTAQLDYCLPSTSKTRSGGEDKSDIESCESIDGDVETVNVTIGKELILKLNEVYGGRTAELLDIIKPTINIPMFLLNEINALWVESVAHQIEENSKQSELMLVQDEELARQLAFKEEELSQAGKEPEIPDFKEIMDMDFAMSLYQKDVAEWRNNLPDDLAAKLSREKLYNLFPTIDNDVLSELLLAHDNNFQSTVEVLLSSTGQSEILHTKNGVNKFVMEKEMERQEKLLQEEKEALSTVEWPLLPKSDKVDMAMVQKYRDEADNHLRYRNLNYQKAHDYIRRGMTQVGSYFSEVAAFHKMKFEQANSWAAASLMQVHAANATDLFTLDLHFLRVCEAKEAVDLFLDSHIQKLRELNISSNKYHNLFFITGRGLHSQGKPKLKPAVKKRLQERGLFCGERNPGLIATKICAANLLSHQIA